MSFSLSEEELKDMAIKFEAIFNRLENQADELRHISLMNYGIFRIKMRFSEVISKKLEEDWMLSNDSHKEARITSVLPCKSYKLVKMQIIKKKTILNIGEIFILIVKSNPPKRESVTRM